MEVNIVGTVAGFCPVCNRQFIKYRSFQKYCSYKCREKATGNKSYYKKAEPVKKKCLTCGKEFETHDGKRKYCCNECYLKHRESYYKKKKPKSKTCPMCGKEFKTTHGLQKYCCKECYLKAKKDREHV